MFFLADNFETLTTSFVENWLSETLFIFLRVYNLYSINLYSRRRPCFWEIGRPVCRPLVGSIYEEDQRNAWFARLWMQDSNDLRTKRETHGLIKP